MKQNSFVMDVAIHGRQGLRLTTLYKVIWMRHYERAGIKWLVLLNLANYSTHNTYILFKLNNQYCQIINISCVINSFQSYKYKKESMYFS